MIEDLSTKRQDLYRLGDVVREAKVMEVTRNRVVLDNRGRREELFGFEKTDVASSPPSPPAGRNRLRPPPPFAMESQPQEPRRLRLKRRSRTRLNLRSSGSVRTCGGLTVMTWLNSSTLSVK